MLYIVEVISVLFGDNIVVEKKCIRHAESEIYPQLLATPMD